MNEIIKSCRIKLKKTQAQMAEYLGLKSPSSYNQKETGKRKFTIEELQKLSKLFKKPINKIILP